MNRRITGLVAAIALALAGTLLLVGYVHSAEASALSDENTVAVLVVKQAVQAGTKASDLVDKVETEQVPAKVKADGAITTLNQLRSLKDKVTTIDLLPGEQVVNDRFGDAVKREGVPDGLLEVTVKLDPERALGGDIRTGDRVAVVSSFGPFDTDAAGSGNGGAQKTPNMTHVILDDVLVTNVQLSANTKSIGKKNDDGKLDQAPEGAMLVTLAVAPDALQQVVFTSEFGFLWLSAQPDGSDVPQLPIITLGSVYGNGIAR